MERCKNGQCVPASFAFLIGDTTEDLTRQCRYPFVESRGYNFFEIMFIVAFSRGIHFTYLEIDNGEQAYYYPELMSILSDRSYEAVIGLVSKNGRPPHAVAWRRNTIYDPFDGQAKTIDTILKEYEISSIAFRKI